MQRCLTRCAALCILRAVKQQSNRLPLYRRVRVSLPVFVLLAVMLAALVWFDNAVNRGVTYTPAPPPIPWTDVPPVGVNAYNIQFEPDRAKVTRTLEMARDLGAHYVRMQFPWEDIEISAKGDFWDHKNNVSAWAKYDFIISETQRLGLEPIVRLDRPPAWARAQANATPEFQRGLTENGSSTGPPDTFQDYFDFVGTVAVHYRGKIRFFQIWNEPNLAYEWNWHLPDPEAFTKLLQGAYTAAKAANPDAVILFPSLSPTDGLEPRIAPISELDYLDRVYQAGGGRYFDIMSAQAYGLGQPPDEHRYIRPRIPWRDWVWSRPIDTRIDVSRLVLLHEVMTRNGDSNKAVWISEFGYNAAPQQAPEGSDPDKWAANRLLWGKPVSEEQKGAYIIGQLERARNEWPWVGVMNVWFLRWGGEAPNPNDPTPYFALVDRDFNPLPAYTMLKQYLAGGIVAGVGAHSWNNPAVKERSSGTWQVQFAGTTFALGGLRSAASIQIDNSVPISVSAADDVQTVASGLAEGTHTAVIETGMPPATFLVGRAQPLPWLWTWGAGVLIVALVLDGALLAWALVSREQSS